MSIELLVGVRILAADPMNLETADHIGKAVRFRLSIKGAEATRS